METVTDGRAGARARVSGMTVLLAVPMLIAALALAGCGGAAGVADMPPAHEPVESTTGATASGALPALLAGRTFLSTSVVGRDLAPGSRVTLSFDGDGSVGANAGCNHMGGAPAWDGDVLAVPEMYMTEMGCEQPLMDQEQWFAGLLAGGVAVALARTTLTLAADSATIQLVEKTAPAAASDASGDPDAGVTSSSQAGLEPK